MSICDTIAAKADSVELSDEEKIIIDQRFEEYYRNPLNKEKNTMTQLIVKPATASNVKRLIQAALEHELRVLKVGIEKTTQKLQRLEQQFGIESQQFYQEFQTGNMGDDIDYIKWAGEYETLIQLQQDYHELLETRLC